MLASFMVLLLEEGPDPQPWEGFQTLHGMIRGSGFEQNTWQQQKPRNRMACVKIL